MDNLSIKKILLASSSPRRKKILEDGGYKPIIIPSFGEIDIVGKKYTKELVNECAREKAVKSYEIYANSLYESVYKEINSTIKVNLGNEEKTFTMKEFIKNFFDDDIEKYYGYLFKNMLLVTADTVVANDGIIYGKPKDRNDAMHMLKSLSDKTHIACTAICLGFYEDDVRDIKINGKNVEIENQAEKDRIVFVTGSEETKVTFRNLTDKEIGEYIDREKPYDKAGSYGIQDESFSFVKKIDGNIDNIIGFPMKRFEEMLAELKKQ